MVGEATGEPLVAFLADMRRMLAECAWKQEQTHRSLARYLLEETHETLEILDRWDETPDAAHLCEELGDLLLQVYFHAALAERSGEFTLDDVGRGIMAKMRRRNPHIFGDAVGGSAAEVNETWQEIKAAETPAGEARTVTDGIPTTLPALLYADKVLERLARQETAPRRTADAPGVDAPELGERLLDLVAEARAGGLDPEQELRDAVRRVLAEADAT